MWLTIRLTLEDRYKIKDPMTDDPVNSLGFAITNDPFIPMISPKAAHPGCDVLVRDS